jgi:hypothetical protein
LRENFDQLIAHFLCELRQILFTKRFDVGWRTDSIEQTLRSVCRLGEFADFQKSLISSSVLSDSTAVFSEDPLLARLEFLYYGFPSAVAGNDFNLLLGVGKTLLAGFYQLHPFLIADDPDLPVATYPIPSARQSSRGDPSRLQSSAPHRAASVYYSWGKRGN